MYNYKDYMKNILAPYGANKPKGSRKSSSAQSDKDQNEKQGEHNLSTQQSNLIAQKRLQLRKASEEFAQQHNVRRSFLFPKNKGIIKIKLGAIFTHREKLPDDYSCFLLQLESIFPCLKPNYRKPSLDEECRNIPENPRSELPPLKLYTVFYLDKNDRHVPLRTEAAYQDFLYQINHDPQLAHPLYGIRVFIVPNQGDEFLNRYSLNGEHEVELDQQMWKLLFTQSNQLLKLRYEKICEKAEEQVKKEELKESKVLKYDGLEEMEVYLVKKWQESKEGKEGEGNSIYVSCNLEKSAESIPVESLDSLRESSDQAQLQIKEMNSELDAISEEEFKLVESDYSSSDQSELDEDLIRKTTRQLIDEMCFGIFSKIRKQDLQEQKFKMLFLDRESSSKSSPQKEDESYVQLNSVDQLAEDIQFSFVQNPYLQESVQIKKSQEEAAPDALKPVIEALIENAEEKQKNNEAYIQQEDIIGEVMEVKQEQNEEVQDQEKEEAEAKVEEGKVVEAGIPEGEAIQAEAVVLDRKEEIQEEEKVKYFNPGSDDDEKNEDLVDKLKSNWNKFVNFLKEGVTNKRKYKWGPFEMAAIVRKIDTTGSIMEAEMKRFQIEEPMCAFPSSIHQHRVRIINLSEFTWPEKVWVDMIRGDKKIKFHKQKIELQLKPTEENQISICFQAPKQTGEYTATFALKGQFNNKQLFFGELIDIRVKVIKPDLDDIRVKVYADAAKLHEEGLADFQDCLRALRVNNNNVQKARENLQERLYDLEH